MNNDTRIELADSIPGAVMKLCGGNLGAWRVCADIATHGDHFDPDAALGGGLHFLLNLDSFGIYESRIWMLYKDVCEGDLMAMCGLLRAHQLGIITQESLDQAIDNRGDGLDLKATLQAVRKRLPNFAVGNKGLLDDELESLDTDKTPIDERSS